MIQIEFKESELQNLLELVYIGEWVKQAYGASKDAEDIDALEQKIYAAACTAGLDEDVEFDKKLGGYVPSQAFEEDCDAIIEAYDENAFWEELIIRMANKELKEQSLIDLPAKEFEKKQAEFIAKFEAEFAANGLDRLSLQ